MKMQKLRIRELTDSFRAILGLVYLMALTIRLMVSISWPIQLNSQNLNGKDHSPQASGQTSTMFRNRNGWFTTHAFTRLLANHDSFLPEFARWRKVFAHHAAAMADLVMTFDGGERLDEDSLRVLFANGRMIGASRRPADMFRPWTNRWSGVWSNGISQYHIWDSTQAVAGRWIQPVSLSETQFVDESHVDEMVQQGKTDVAINVVDSDLEITGWVSKWQNAELELPHIGYRVNDTTLVWICQIKTAETLFERDNRWFVFLETVDMSVLPVQYQIYGLPIEISDAVYVDAGEQGRHHATYYATNQSTSQLDLIEQTTI